MKKRQHKPDVKRRRSHKQAPTERALLYMEHTMKHYESGIGFYIGHEDANQRKKRKEKKMMSPEKKQSLVNGVSNSCIRPRTQGGVGTTRRILLKGRQPKLVRK